VSCNEYVYSPKKAEAQTYRDDTEYIKDRQTTELQTTATPEDHLFTRSKKLLSLLKTLPKPTQKPKLIP